MKKSNIKNFNDLFKKFDENRRLLVIIEELRATNGQLIIIFVYDELTVTLSSSIIGLKFSETWIINLYI